MLRDHLKAIANRNVCRFCHRAGDGVAKLAAKIDGAPGTKVDTNERHARIVPSKYASEPVASTTHLGGERVLVGAAPVHDRDRDIEQAQVDHELAAMVVPVVE